MKVCKYCADDEIFLKHISIPRRNETDKKKLRRFYEQYKERMKKK